MIYSAADIHFEQLSPTEFEWLCFELLLKLGFRQLVWRQGGADNGRDIEGLWSVETPFDREDMRWFFECKHYAAGVPPQQLNAKIAWADAEQPACLVVLVSSYLTNNARSWLDQIRAQKRYRILVIEGPELKNLLIRFPTLIEQHFRADRYGQLLLDVKRHRSEYRIALSYDLLYALSQRLDPARLTLSDLGFLFTGLYSQYKYLFDCNDYYGDFDPKVMAPSSRGCVNWRALARSGFLISIGTIMIIWAAAVFGTTWKAGNWVWKGIVRPTTNTIRST